MSFLIKTLLGKGTSVFGSTLTEDEKSIVPRVVEHAVNYLEARVNDIDLETLFPANANASFKDELHLLKKQYDAEKVVDLSQFQDPAIVVELLKLFLRELPEPPIPYQKFKEVIGIAENKDGRVKAKALGNYIDGLPRVNREVLKSICGLLSRYCHRNVSKLTAISTLAEVMAPLFMHPKKEKESTSSDREKAIEVTRVMIGQYGAVFKIDLPPTPTDGTFQFKGKRDSRSVMYRISAKHHHKSPIDVRLSFGLEVAILIGLS